MAIMAQFAAYSDFIARKDSLFAFDHGFSVTRVAGPVRQRFLIVPERDGAGPSVAGDV